MIIDCGKAGVAGYYTFELNGEPVFSVPSKNLITDYGWTRFSNLNSVDIFNTVLQVGTSNTPPALSDTALGALLASKTGGSGVPSTGSDAIGAYSATKYSFAFATGAVIGNVAEVGLKVDAADVSLTSRSLVKDAGGNPAVIVCTAIDQLTVVYELRVYRAAIDTTTSLTIGGVSTTLTLRTGGRTNGVSDIGSRIAGLNPSHSKGARHINPGSLGAAGSNPSASDWVSLTDSLLNTKVVTVNPTNTVVTFNTATYGTGAGNIAGGVQILHIYFGEVDYLASAYSSMQCQFTPPIAKDNTKTIFYSFSFTFTRL